MQYLGGKSRIAKEIAAVVAPKGVWWEPFCGGLSVSVQLAKYGPGVVSDVNPALISLYQAVRDGWQPPQSLSEPEWRLAKFLPDTDPLKAFAGFGCSFGGRYFEGYAKPDKRRLNGEHYAASAARAVKRDTAEISGCVIACLSFLEIDPQTSPTPECIYADPPYEGTKWYSGTKPMDHGRFWAYCQEWASRGVRVFVSEYRCPVDADLIWEKGHRIQVKGGTGQYTAERLFLVKAPSVARVA